MNRRYRRQMQLRSRAHRNGELLGCGCHPSRQRLTTPVKPRIHILPDISSFQEGMVRLREMAATMGPMIERTNESLKEVARRFYAEPE